MPLHAKESQENRRTYVNVISNLKFYVAIKGRATTFRFYVVYIDRLPQIMWNLNDRRHLSFITLAERKLLPFYIHQQGE